MVYEFIWDEFCDWYIELTKSRLYDEDNIRDRRVAQNVLRRVLLDQLRLLHPFMPFITEEIYQHLPDIESSIMIDRWPEQDEKLVWPEAVEEMKTIMSVIRAVRNLRSEFNIAPGVRVRVVVSTDDENMGNIIRSGSSYIQQLANTADIVIHSTPGQVQEQVLSTHLGDMEVMIPVEGAIDKEKEVARLQKDMAKIEKELQRVMGKLRNEVFEQGTWEVVAKEKAKREEIEAKRRGWPNVYKY